MTVVARFLDAQLAEDARYGGQMDLDECPPLPAALDRHLRSRARSSAARLRANQELRARFGHQDGILRLLAYAYAAMPGYRDSWQPSLAEGRVPAEPEWWSVAETLARQAAEEAGFDFGWREVDRQDGHGLVLDGAGRPLWDVAVYPEDGFLVSRHGPGRVLREVAARRALLAGLGSTEADEVMRRLLVEPLS